MKKTTTKYLVIITLTIIYACSTMNKEVYLDNYKDSIQNINNDHDEYTLED